MYLKFNTKKSAQEWINEVDKIFGYPSKKKFGTKTFSEVLKGSDAKWYVLIPDYRIHEGELSSPLNNVPTDAKLVENSVFTSYEV